MSNASNDPLLQPYRFKHLTLKNRMSDVASHNIHAGFYDALRIYSLM